MAIVYPVSALLGVAVATGKWLVLAGYCYLCEPWTSKTFRMESWTAVALNLKEVETLLWESGLNLLKRGLLGDVDVP